MKQLVCKQCGGKFEDFLSSKRVYCSTKCFDDARRFPKSICPICGKIARRVDIKYCSSKCYHESRAGKPRPEIMRRVVKHCLSCKKEFITGGRIGKKEKKYCDKRCAAKAKWAPIENQFNRSRSGHWRELREKILERDGHECAVCSHTEGLQIHHIIPRRFGGTHEINNLTTVCRLCHGAIDRIIIILKNKNKDFDIEKWFKQNIIK